MVLCVFPYSCFACYLQRTLASHSIFSRLIFTHSFSFPTFHPKVSQSNRSLSIVIFVVLLLFVLYLYRPCLRSRIIMALAVNPLINVKDSRWLQLEVCREYQRNKCTRSDAECKFAHPATNVEIQNGRVVACYDSIKVNICVDNI